MAFSSAHHEGFSVTEGGDGTAVGKAAAISISRGISSTAPWSSSQSAVDVINAAACIPVSYKLRATRHLFLIQAVKSVAHLLDLKIWQRATSFARLYKRLSVGEPPNRRSDSGNGGLRCYWEQSLNYYYYYF